MEKLSRLEMETIINFNKEEFEAEVYTHESRLIRRLKQFANQCPDLCKFESENEHGGVTYTLPKKYIKIGMPMSNTDGRKNNKGNLPNIN
jgi:hypothetical protein